MKCFKLNVLNFFMGKPTKCWRDIKKFCGLRFKKYCLAIWNCFPAWRVSEPTCSYLLGQGRLQPNLAKYSPSPVIAFFRLMFECLLNSPSEAHYSESLILNKWTCQITQQGVELLFHFSSSLFVNFFFRSSCVAIICFTLFK